MQIGGESEMQIGEMQIGRQIVLSSSRRPFRAITRVRPRIEIHIRYNRLYDPIHVIVSAEINKFQRILNHLKNLFATFRMLKNLS